MLDIVTFIWSLVAVYLVAVIPLTLMQGHAGLLSLALAASFGIGAYGTAVAQLQLDAPLILALGIAVAVAVCVQLVMSYPSLGLGSLYFVVATLAFQFILDSVFDNWQSVTGGASGLFGLPVPGLFRLDLRNEQAYAIFLTGVVVLSFLVTSRLAHSRFGLQLRGIRDDAIAMEALGHDPRRAKVLVAVYFAAWAGVAGGLYASLLAIVNPTDFGLTQSILMQAFIIVGGAGNIWAPLIGVPLLIGFPEALRYAGLPDSVAGSIREGLYGLLLVLAMRLRPEGLFPERIADAGPRWLTRRQSVAPEMRVEHEPAAPVHEPQPTEDARTVGLRAEGITVRFGGVHALIEANLTVRAGTITALIGPNGAGKSTLLNVITGFIKPNEGRIMLGERDISGLPARRRVDAGVARSFQDLRALRTLSVRQSLASAMLPRVQDRTALEAEVARTTAAFGLDRIARERVSGLSYGDQKLLSIAMVAATGCPMLILDEPMSGLDLTQIGTVTTLLERLVGEGRTICLVEHNMDIVRATADRVCVLHQGRSILEGETAEVLSHDTTLEVYLGA